MTLSQRNVELAQRHLAKSDADLRKIIRKIGPCTLRPQRDRFGLIIRSIVSQQISVAAARTIMSRLVAATAEPRTGRITANSLRGMTPAKLRKLGVSKQKAGYMIDLRDRVASGEVDLRNVGRKDDEAVIESLTQVKGIGVWTAQMFLMFCLGRPDVFPVGDLGLRNAMKTIYGLGDDARHERYCAVAERWQPYRTVGSWYCWRSLELSP